MWNGKLFESLMVDGRSVFIYEKVFALGKRKMRPSWFFKGYDVLGGLQIRNLITVWTVWAYKLRCLIMMNDFEKLLHWKCKWMIPSMIDLIGALSI